MIPGPVIRVSQSCTGYPVRAMCAMSKKTVGGLSPLTGLPNFYLLGRFRPQIIERGTHRSLLEQKGFYHNLYMSQSKGHAI